jgi:WS/DGAT/MGAT family acyltransferase
MPPTEAKPGTHARLTPLDATFLAVESPTAHMHVGWVGLFRPPEGSERPSFNSLREYVRSRLPRAPRYRQKLAFVPLGIHDPVWVDDPQFDVRHHVVRSAAKDVDHLVERAFSTQLKRDRPLWEVWIADRLADGRIAIAGKVHHCMVDGIAAAELVALLLDPSPEGGLDAPQDWTPERPPRVAALFAQALRDRVDEEADLLRIPVRLARSPRALVDFGRKATTAGRSLSHSVPAAPPSPFNRPISAHRSLGRVQCPVADLLRVKQRYGTSLNDVVLAVAAGGVRRFLQQHGEETIRLKTMVPVSMRADGSPGDLGNQVSLLSIDLPCDEPDPVRRLEDVHAAMSDRKAAGEALGGRALLAAFGYAPHPVQHALTRAAASSRTFNLVVSNVPGPRVPMYVLGCSMEEVYPVVPIADNHTVAIGFTTYADQAFFGVYVDRKAVPDADLLARDVERSIGELLDGVPETATERYLRTT